MRFPVFLCYSVRYLHVFLCGFAGIGTHLTPPSMKNSGWFLCLGYRNTLAIYHVKCFRQSLSSFTWIFFMVNLSRGSPVTCTTAISQGTTVKESRITTPYVN